MFIVTVSVFGLVSFLSIEAFALDGHKYGTPSRSDGHYFLTNHAPKQDVTRSVYYEAYGVTEFALSGVSVYLWGMTLAWAVQARLQRSA